MKKIIIFFCITSVFIYDHLLAQTSKPGFSAAERKVKVSWEKVDGAVSYKIQIKDSKGNIIVNQEADSNNIILELPPADYKIRIGSVNKFNKISNWSEWAALNVKEPLPVAQEKEKKPVNEKNKEISKTGGWTKKISAGLSYFYILPDWDEYYKKSAGISGNFSYGLNNINFSGPLVFLKHTGFDIESSYVKFRGKKAFNRVESDITNILSGVNIFISMNINPSLSFAIRGGGGLAFTKQQYKKYDTLGTPVDKGTNNTSDLYYKAGISADYTFYSRFFVATFIDYYSINYLLKEFRSYRGSLQAGVRF